MPVKQQKYSVKLQMILSIIPLVSIMAFYRIEKLRVWVKIFAVYVVIGIIEEVLIPNPSNTRTIVDILFTVSLLFTNALAMKHFTIKWNEIQFK
jgi:hypothetical protein